MSITLLVVEDDNILRKSLVYYLKSKDYEVIDVDNGNEAISLIANQKFDIIITDLNLPYKSGMEILYEVREIFELDIPVIILTNHGSESVEIESFELGASEFISKPFSPPILNSRIQKLLS